MFGSIPVNFGSDDGLEYHFSSVVVYLWYEGLALLSTEIVDILFGAWPHWEVVSLKRAC